MFQMPRLQAKIYFDSSTSDKHNPNSMYCTHPKYSCTHTYEALHEFINSPYVKGHVKQTSPSGILVLGQSEKYVGSNIYNSASNVQNLQDLLTKIMADNYLRAIKVYKVKRGLRVEVDSLFHNNYLVRILKPNVQIEKLMNNLHIATGNGYEIPFANISSVTEGIA